MSPVEPSISVVVPARNEAELIAGVVHSVAEQTYQGTVECIVVDNGSSDGTAQVVRVAGAECRVNLRIVPEPAMGVGRAKNTGATEALGDVLVFVDGDSRMEPDLLTAISETYGRGFRAGSIRVVSDGGGRLDRAFFQLMELGKRRFGIRAQMLFCERELFGQLGGFDPRLHLGEDTELLARAGRNLAAAGLKPVCHISSSAIRTSPRRIAANHHLGMLRMFGRWALAFLHIGRRRAY